MNNNKCKYCTYSKGEWIGVAILLLCEKKKRIVESDDTCNLFEREPGSDDDAS